MLMLLLSFVSCIYINRKKYDIDDLPLTQMVLHLATGVNTEHEDAEDEEEDESYEEMYNEGGNEGTFLFFVDIKFLL